MVKKIKEKQNKKIVIGIFLVVWGIYLLAKKYGLVSESFPFWPLILVLVGIHMLVKKKIC